MGLLSNQMIAGAAGAAGGGGSTIYDYQIAKSFRWDSGYLKWTPGSAGNRQTWTFSCWIKQSGTLANYQGEMALLNAGTSGNQSTRFRMYYYEQQLRSSSADANYNVSSGVYRDPSAWQHIVWKLSGGTSYQYVNGVEVSTSSVSGDVAINNNVEHVLGVYGGYETATRFKGYMAEVVFIDGTALDPTSFASEKNGVWIPDDVSGLTFGSQGYYLDFADASAPGNDVSGNNNDWTNVSLATHDQMLDTPTFNSSSNGGNFATWNFLSRTNPSLSYGATTFSEGDLAFAGATGGTASTGSTFSMQSGKWYAEIMQSGSPAGGWPGLGLIYTNKMGTAQGTSNIQPQNGFTSYIELVSGNLYKFDASSGASYGSAFGNGDICNIAVDIDAGKIWWGKNGSWFASGNPATGANAGDTFTAGTTLSLWVAGYNGNGTSILNAGQDGTFAGAKTAQGNSDNTGYGNFYYTPKTIASGFLAMCSGNLPVAAEVDPAQTEDNFPQKLFSPKIWTGDGNSGRSITIDMAKKPSLSIIRQRNSGNNWNVWTQGYNNGDYDSFGEFNTSAWYANQGVSGPYTAAPTESALTLTGYGQVNASGQTYVNYKWVANGGTTSTNTTGSIDTTVEVDPSGGFSVVTWTGTGGSVTLGHGLNAAPSMLICKPFTSGAALMDWTVFHKNMGTAGAFPADNSRMYLNSNGTYSVGSNLFVPSGNTSSVFEVNSNINPSSKDMVAFCFTNVEGYIAANNYTGNGGDDGTFIYMGFKPAWFMIKDTGNANNWIVYDSARETFNVMDKYLNPDTAGVEESGDLAKIDFLSNGVKMRTDHVAFNGSGRNYIYLAFAHNPFKYSLAR